MTAMNIMLVLSSSQTFAAMHSQFITSRTTNRKTGSNPGKPENSDTNNPVTSAMISEKPAIVILPLCHYNVTVTCVHVSCLR